MTATTTRAAECWAHIIAEVDPMPVSIAADYATDDGSEPHEACAAVEAVAQQHLDAHPADHRARRLLGEWLQWHGDVRGEGYRALAACGRFPARSGNDRGPGGYAWTWFRSDMHDTDDLHSDWFMLIDLSGCVMISSSPVPHWADWITRRAAESAASLAFARLSAARRAALLKGEM